ncbi:MAG TPA: acyl carrier protein [Bacteroidia bacterium]|nr:acyl carrier protein [Bacteroidia bacterium]
MENFKERFENLIIEKLDVDKEQIIPEARFIKDLDADSLDMAELVIEIEKEFNISVSDDAVEKIKTIADAEKYIIMMVNIKK